MKYWKRVDDDGKTIAVESYSHDLDVVGAIEIMEAEFNNFLDSLASVPQPPLRNVFEELEELKVRVVKLESTALTR